MKVGSFVLLAGTLLAASGVPLDVTDARNKKPAGVTVDASGPDAEGWCALRVTKSKGDVVLIWPWDGAAKQPDGPEPVPVIVIRRGEEKALENPRVVAAIATPVILGLRQMADAASATGFTEDAIREAIRGLASASDPYAKGLGLLYSRKSDGAVDELAKALRERQRQLTRVPSEIFPAAMLYGHALMAANKFDLAAVAYLAALKIRPSDENARMARADALTKAGKAEAAAEAAGKHP